LRWQKTAPQVDTHKLSSSSSPLSDATPHDATGASQAAALLVLVPGRLQANGPLDGGDSHSTSGDEAGRRRADSEAEAARRDGDSESNGDAHTREPDVEYIDYCVRNVLIPEFGVCVLVRCMARVVH
jgi:hypothetical protein